jgi:hypothetical protein
MSISQCKRIAIPAPLFNIGESINWRYRGNLVNAKVYSIIYCEEEDGYYWQYIVVFLDGKFKGQEETVFESDVTDYWDSFYAS